MNDFYPKKCTLENEGYLSQKHTCSSGYFFPKKKCIVLWVENPFGEDVVCEIGCKTITEQHKFPPGFTGLIASSNFERIKITSGKMNVIDMDACRFTKWQAFIDAAKKDNHMANKHEYRCAVVSLDRPLTLTIRAIEKILLMKSLESPSEIIPLSQALRSNEGYHLVSFLISKVNENLSIKNLGTTYGLSSAHFRRLSRAALGNVVKQEVSDWKLVNAVLDMLEGKENLTNIAYKYGYSSLAHFSKVVKKKFNLSPSGIINKIRHIK